MGLLTPVNLGGGGGSMIVIHSWLASCNLFLVLRIIIKQPSPRRAAYCIPHGPLPQLFVFKIATNLSTSASSYFT